MNVLQGSCYLLRDEFTLLGYNYLASQKGLEEQGEFCLMKAIAQC